MDRDIAIVTAIATSSVALLTIFIVIAGWKQATALNRSLRSQIYFNTFTLLEGEDGKIRELRHCLEEGIKTAGGNIEKFDAWEASDKDNTTKLDKLAREYDKIGHLVKHGVVPLDFLLDFYSRPIVIAWQYIGPSLIKEGLSRGQPTHMKSFHILAIGAAIYRKKEYSEGPPFSIPRENEREWKRWKKWCK